MQDYIDFTIYSGQIKTTVYSDITGQICYSSDVKDSPITQASVLKMQTNCFILRICPKKQLNEETRSNPISPDANVNGLHFKSK